jgi:ribulose-5-phosphate 4-epimerase/fuculose-1-phosphate aldolase
MSDQALQFGPRHNQSFEEERRDLACAFRWTARLEMHEGVANHFSLAVDEEGKTFLINPANAHFSKVKASDLLLIHADQPGGGPDGEKLDLTAWALHGAIHRNHPEIRCVLHVHSHYATALAALTDCRIPPIDQNTMRFFNRVSVDEGFDGMGLGDEAERVSREAEPGKPVMVLANHGVMAFGRDVAEAFDTLYYFERACRTYITALSSGIPLRIASDAVAEKTARQWEDYGESARHHLNALRAILDEEDPGYAG